MCVCVCMSVFVWLPGVTSSGGSVQRPLSSKVSVIDVCAVLQQELARQQRPLQAAERNSDSNEVCILFTSQLSKGSVCRNNITDNNTNNNNDDVS